jgi:uncharacterized protein
VCARVLACAWRYRSQIRLNSTSYHNLDLVTDERVRGVRKTGLLDRKQPPVHHKGMNREQVIATLRRHELELRASGIMHLALFGSTARGEQGQESDIDLLAAYDPGRRISLLDIVGLEMGISAMLGRKVDLIEEGTLKPRVQRTVEDELLRAF